MSVKSLKEAGSLGSKYVLLRGSLNAPLKNGEVADTFRLERLLKTLEFLKSSGAKTILIGHIGRELTDTLKPVHAWLQAKTPISWGGVVTSTDFMTARNEMKDGEVLMAENLRQDPKEKANDPDFAAYLASLADMYVNEAFENAHREHASMLGVTEHLPSYAGFNLENEIKELDRVLKPESPSLFMLGGAKFETKLPLIEKMLAVYDRAFIGGAIANDVLKAQGFPVGKSLLSDIELDKELVQNPKLLAPIDVRVENSTGEVRVCNPIDVKDDEIIKDVGPKTIEQLKPLIGEAKTILWNGPFGLYEGAFKESTDSTAKLVAESSAMSILGGGDTIAAINNMQIGEQFTFLSTGGGAMLTYLEKGSTPAIDALK